MRPVVFCAGLRRAAFLVVLFWVCLLSGLVAHAQQDEQSAAPPPEDTSEEGVPVSTQQAEVSAAETSKSNFNTRFTVTPIVANETAKPRDIIKKELVVANNTNERVGLRASVENIDPEAGAQEFVSPGVADLTRSLANWIEITRGVIDLAPGESRKIPYLIHVNVTAEPGNYFARIAFTDGTPVAKGAEQAREDGTSLLLNVQVVDDARERLQLGSFLTRDSLVFGDEVGFTFQVENVGNRTIEPRGAIRIFNRRGEEVGSVPLNAGGVEVSPENAQQLASAWSAAGRFGKYKAFLDLEYGENQVASVQDTVYFWVFPWREILMTLVGVLTLAVFGTYVVHMRTVVGPVHAHIPQAYTQPFQPTPHRHSTVMMPSQRDDRRPVPQKEGATVVLGRAKQATTAVSVQGARVDLKSRATMKPPETHGNVVQLSSRR